MPIKELETPRLKLIELNTNHLEDLFTIYKDDETMRYWDDYPHNDKQQTKKLLDLFARRIKEGTGICWGITLKENDQKVIGTISYNRYSKDGIGTIGYILARDYWNKGIMTEVLTEFIEFGFTDLGIHRIEAHVEPGNIGSEKILEKIGFQREGLLRQRHQYKGKYQDQIYYALQRTDKRKTEHH